MVEFLLPDESVLRVSEEDAALIETYPWRRNTRGDVVASIQGRNVLLRREIAKRSGLLRRKHYHVLHLDDDQLNCERDNLLLSKPQHTLKRKGVIKLNAIEFQTDRSGIYLDNGKKVLLDAQDFDIFALHHWNLDKRGFVFRSEEYSGVRHGGARALGNDNGNVYLHHEVAEHMSGKALWLNQRVRHIDGNKLNNHRANLRILPPGIRRLGAKYGVALHIDGGTFSGGSYETFEEAAFVYNALARLLYQERAYQHDLPADYNMTVSPGVFHRLKRFLSENN